MARKPKARKQVTKKYQINLTRGGAIRYDDAFNALDAARSATKHARQGWTAEVVTFSGRGMYNVGRRTSHMTCTPTIARGKTVAACNIKPAFKKRIKGL